MAKAMAATGGVAEHCVCYYRGCGRFCHCNGPAENAHACRGELRLVGFALDWHYGILFDMLDGTDCGTDFAFMEKRAAGSLIAGWLSLFLPASHPVLKCDDVCT